MNFAERAGPPNDRGCPIPRCRWPAPSLRGHLARPSLFAARDGRHETKGIIKKQTQFVVLTSLTTIAAMLACANIWGSEKIVAGVILGMGLQLGIVRLSRIMWCGLLMFSLIAPDVSAQEPPEKFPAYQWDTVGALRVSMPVHPGQAGLGLLAGAVCVGVAAGVIGYIGAKVISACIKVKEFIVTNNAACGECPLESPIPTAPVPVVTGPPPATSDCVCDAPPPEE